MTAPAETIAFIVPQQELRGKLHGVRLQFFVLDLGPLEAPIRSLNKFQQSFLQPGKPEKNDSIHENDKRLPHSTR